MKEQTIRTRLIQPTIRLLLLAGILMIPSGSIALARAGTSTENLLPPGPGYLQRSSSEAVQSAPTSTDSETRPELVEIRQARITKVEKFFSRSKKTHFRFEFVVNQKAYRGIMFEGDWNSDHVARLRSGKATLIGYWDTYQGNPSFVAKTVKP